MSLPLGPVALLRGVPASFPQCVTSRPPRPPLHPGLAAEQQAAYAAALAAGGFRVVTVAADDAHPDCAFIEDTAVVIGGRALLARPGHPSRRGEVPAVAAALAGFVAVDSLEAGTLDGGDVLQVAGRVYAGLSRRSDAAGVAGLGRFARPTEVVPVPVRETLHLKSGVSAIDDETVLWHPAACDREALVGVEVIPVPGDDPEAANVVRLPDGSILVAAHHSATARLLDSRGLAVRSVDVSEFARADGGLTCLSLRLRALGAVSSWA